MSKASGISPKDKGKHKLSNFITLLEKSGIRLVALDFDQTLISIHSGGVWKGDIEKLVQHVRPCMKDLLDMAMHHGLHVCIVTYFMQPWVIREMLSHLFKRDASRIFIQANTVEFREKHKHQFLGKEAHIAAVCTELYNLKHTIVKPEEIILFDDDRENIETAMEFGHWAVEVKDDICYESFDRFSEMFKHKSSISKGRSKSMS